MNLFYLEFANIGILILFSIILVLTILFLSIRLNEYSCKREFSFNSLITLDFFTFCRFKLAILLFIKSCLKMNKYLFCDSGDEHVADDVFNSLNMPLSIDGGFLFMGVCSLIFAGAFMVYGGEKPKPKPDDDDDDPDPFNFEGSLFGAIKVLIGPDRNTDYDCMSIDRLRFSSALIKYSKGYHLLNTKEYLQITGALMSLDTSIMAFGLLEEGTKLTVVSINSIFFNINRKFLNNEFCSQFKGSEIELLKKIHSVLMEEFPFLKP